MNHVWQAVGNTRWELYITDNIMLVVFSFRGEWHSGVNGLCLARCPLPSATADEAKKKLMAAVLDECGVVASRLEAMR